MSSLYFHSVLTPVVSDQFFPTTAALTGATNPGPYETRNNIN